MTRTRMNGSHLAISASVKEASLAGMIEDKELSGGVSETAVPGLSN